MPRYIDADKLPITTVAIQPYALSEKPYNAEVVFAQAIKAAPTVDVREVVHGTWIRHDDGYVEYYECSHCLKISPQENGYDFCPYCGAKMDNVERDT